MVRMPIDGSWVYNTVWFLLRVFYPFFCRIRVEGVEHVPLEGGCVLACNHNMGPDYFVLGVCMPRQIYFMGKTEIFHYHPLIAALFNAMGIIAVERGRQDTAALSRATQVVQDGLVLGMYPEGTRSRSGKLQRGKSGTARIALAADTFVIPVVVINSPAVFGHLFKQLRRPQVIVRFGAPQRWAHDPSEDAATARLFTEQIMRAMAELLPPELRGVYAEEAADRAVRDETAADES